MTSIQIVFPKPCHADWDRMEAQGRFRFCSTCSKPVYDLAEHTPEEVERLLSPEAARVCVRAEVLPDGHVRTLASLTSKMLRAAVLTPAIIAAMSASVAVADPAKGAISGEAEAEHYASVKIIAVGAGSRHHTRTNEGGGFHIGGLAPGNYRLLFSTSSGHQWSVDQVTVQANNSSFVSTVDPELQRSRSNMSPPVRATAGMPVPTVPAPIGESILPPPYVSKAPMGEAIMPAPPAPPS